MKEFTYGFGKKPRDRIADDLLGLIGKTPMVRLRRFAEAERICANLCAKLEYMNPGGSVKDRVALAMIEDAEEKGLLDEDTVIVEPTSGNTGIGLATVAAVRGYRIILVMPENMSDERKKILRALGAQLELTPADQGMQGAVARAEQLKTELPKVFIPGQFVNPANPKAHMLGTAQEILKDTFGCVDIFVAGVGSGGTVTGVGKVLKAIRPSVKIVAVEPAESPLLKGGQPGPHAIQGIGANFVPEILDRSVIDEVYDVAYESARAAARSAARTEGLLVGISSGAALFAAKRVGERAENRDKNMVVLLPDGGEKYLSTPLFDD